MAFMLVERDKLVFDILYITLQVLVTFQYKRGSYPFTNFYIFSFFAYISFSNLRVFFQINTEQTGMTARKYVKKETFNVLKSVDCIPVVIRYYV